MKWQDRWRDKVKTPEEAARLIKSGDRIVLSAGPPQPLFTCAALANRRDELEDVAIASIHGAYPYPWLQPGCEKSFKVVSLYTAPFSRQADKEKRSEWVPSIWGIADGIRHTEPLRETHYTAADVFLFSIPPPDSDGQCSFGPAPWYSPVSARTAKVVIAEVDPTLAWTYGESIHVSQLTCLVEASGPPPPFPRLPLPLPPEEDVGPLSVIGSHVAGLIRDGDTIQVGTGSASEAVLEFLSTKNDLGIDTEIIPVTMMDLVQAGVFTGKYNNSHPGKHFATACLIYNGHPRLDELMGFIDGNPAYELHDISYMCNIPRIASIDRFVAINNALTIDLTGQLIVTHVGPVPISGIGGQLEFTVGAHYSKGGRAITTLLSTAKGGTVSRIVPQFEAGAMIGVPNVYVDYLVTEHGVVNLDCKSLRERAEAIISVAHPDFRPELKKAARKLFWP